MHALAQPSYAKTDKGFILNPPEKPALGPAKEPKITNQTTTAASPTEKPASKPKPKRQRLSKKQYAFLNNVFVAHMSIHDTLSNLRIRRKTFDRWLKKPLFIKELQMNLRYYYLQTQFELVRGTSSAINGLVSLSANCMKVEEVRKACNDLLNYQKTCTKVEQSSKQQKDGVVLDKFGALLEQFGVKLDNNGNPLEQLGAEISPKYPVSDQISSKTTSQPPKTENPSPKPK